MCSLDFRGEVLWQECSQCVVPVVKSLLHFVDNQVFTKLFERSSLTVAHALVAFRHSQYFHCTDSSSIGRFPYSIAEGAVKWIECSTLLGRKRGTDGQSLLSESLPGVHGTCLSKKKTHHPDAVAALAHYRGDNPSSQERDPGVPGFSSDYSVLVDSEAFWDIAD